MASRPRQLANLIKRHVESLPSETTLDVRLDISIPDDPKIWSECPKPSLLLVPFGESRSRGRASVVRRPQVNLTFAGPLGTKLRKDDYGLIVEGVTDSLELVKLKGDPAKGELNFLWFETEIDSLWDPLAVANGRFGSQYRVTYTAGKVVTR